MRTLEVRRHTMRRKPGQHLSQDGIELARLVGKTSGPFSLVVTSHIPRAIETAIAMGFEVDETNEFLAHIPLDVLTSAQWPSPFSSDLSSRQFGRSCREFRCRIGRYLAQHRRAHTGLDTGSHRHPRGTSRSGSGGRRPQLPARRVGRRHRLL